MDYRHEDDVDDYGVHNTHCCRRHGCKYGDNDCPVEFGDAEGVKCEWCEEDDREYDFRLIEVLKMLDDERVISKIRDIIGRKS